MSKTAGVLMSVQSAREPGYGSKMTRAGINSAAVELTGYDERAGIGRAAYRPRFRPSPQVLGSACWTMFTRG